MRKSLKVPVIILGVAFLGAQLVRPARTNPAVDPSQAIYSRMEMPADVAMVLQRSCHDCHSDLTEWPWYSHVAPVSWLVADDVNQGRRHMNLSEWGKYEAKKQRDLLEDVCDELSQGEMPLDSYLLIHRDARVTKDDVRAVCEWTQAARQKLAAASR